MYAPGMYMYVLGTYQTVRPYKVQFLPVKGRVFPYENPTKVRTLRLFWSPKNTIFERFCGGHCPIDNNKVQPTRESGGGCCDGQTNESSEFLSPPCRG